MRSAWRKEKREKEKKKKREKIRKEPTFGRICGEL